MEERKGKWYIVRSQVNKEKSVSERIIKESEVGDLVGKVSKVVIPTEITYYVKKGKKIKREKILYPGYIFVESTDVASLKEYLKNVNGASGFLTTRSGSVQSLSDKEASTMLNNQEETIKNKDIDDKYMISEEVMIIDGPFSSMKGIIEEITEKSVKVGVNIFGRKMPIQLSVLQISKA